MQHLFLFIGSYDEAGAPVVQLRAKAANGDEGGGFPLLVFVPRAVVAAGASMGFAPVMEQTIGRMSTWKAFCINALPMKMAVLKATSTMS